MRPLIAHCRLGLGILHGKTGERERAGTELAAARVLFHSMAMSVWLGQVAGALEGIM